MFSCKQTRYVKDGDYLLNKNTVIVNSSYQDSVGGKQSELSSSEIEEVVKPKENKRFLGLKLKLAFYNSVDTNKVVDIRKKKIAKNKIKNKKRKAKVEYKNDRRIYRALKKGETQYTRKIAKLKDTVVPKKGFLDWWQNELGEEPTIYDSASVVKSKKQIQLFLEKNGFYYSQVTDTLLLNEAKRKAEVVYKVKTGRPYVIDSISVVSENLVLAKEINQFLKKKGKLRVGKVLNAVDLDDERTSLSAYLRDEAYYGFSTSHIYYRLDTNKSAMTARVEIGTKQRKYQDRDYGDSIFTKPHQTYKIRKVYFHISDTMRYNGNFKELSRSLFGDTIGRDDKGFFYNVDTLVTADATYYYNGKLEVKDHLLELQNFLEANNSPDDNNFYKDKYLTRSYSRLMQLGVFSSVKPVIVEVGMTNKLDIHYYLVPAKKQNFSFEPRGTHSNGFLGFSASVNYTNKNLFRGAEKFVVSISGGFESQPPVFETGGDGSTASSTQRSFNTFDIGPKISLEMPGLFPIPARKLSKRQVPHTIFSALYNYQKRTDFQRHLIQLDYNWKWLSGKTQTFQGSIFNPVKFSFIDPTPEFQIKIDTLNDLFIKNAYSSQFTWEDIKISHVFNNQKQNLDNGKTSHFYNNIVLNHAGMMSRLVTANQSPNSNNQRVIAQVPFSQFVRLENESKYYQSIGKKHSLNYRVNFGIGIPYGNSHTTMPFEYSFFAGGSNDNRGHVARTLGPGSYKYYIDKHGTSTQIGDIKIALNVEYRFDINETFKFAFFVDAGNIWTLREDANRPGGQISKDFYKELAVSSGIGIRLDFNFFIFRVDLGIPLNNPSFPNGEQWIWNKNRPQWHQELESTYGEEWGNHIGNQFVPRFNIGIGYPF